MSDTDSQVRLRAFQFLEDQVAVHGSALPRSVLERGFDYEGKRVPLISPQGIFTPAVLDLPLTFTTVPIVEGQPRPYEDEVDENGLIRYRYRGIHPQHRDNIGLRTCMHRHIPLIYLFGIVPGRYEPVWPVYIVGDDPASLTFTVEVGDSANLRVREDTWVADESKAKRAYMTVATQRRLHQDSFRFRVVRAYRKSCAVCRLRHDELLDAAHILPDKHVHGEPWVCNGLSLCKLHHAAFDANILGVRPDLMVEIRKDVLEEHDGPMLEHGLKECHERRLVVVPRQEELKPRKDFLEERYEMFRTAR
jgi:putative restriction endonuclease